MQVNDFILRQINHWRWGRNAMMSSEELWSNLKWWKTKIRGNVISIFPSFTLFFVDLFWDFGKTKQKGSDHSSQLRPRVDELKGFKSWTELMPVEGPEGTELKQFVQHWHGRTISKHWFQCRDFSCHTHQWPLKSCYLQQYGGQTNILFVSFLIAPTGRSKFLISEMMIILLFTILSFDLERKNARMMKHKVALQITYRNNEAQHSQDG